MCTDIMIIIKSNVLCIQILPFGYLQTTRAMNFMDK